MPAAMTLRLYDNPIRANVGILKRLQEHAPLAGLVAFRVDHQRAEVAVGDGRNRDAGSRRGKGGER